MEQKSTAYFTQLYNYAYSNYSAVVKNLPANEGDMGSTPGLGRSPEGGNGNPLQ